MITGVHHFSFTVSNLEESILFFCDILGLKATPIREATGPNLEKTLKLPGASIRIINLTTPDNRTIELIEYRAPKGQKIDLKTCNPGVAHIGFMVDNIERMYEDLSVKGVQFNNAPIRRPDGSSGVCYLKGPDGITLEFVEVPKT